MSSAYDLGISKDSDLDWFTGNFDWSCFAISLQFTELHALSWKVKCDRLCIWAVRSNVHSDL